MGERLFRHFKTGKVYKYLGRPVHTETSEQLVLYSEAGLEAARMFVRPKDMFFGNVTVDGVEQKRFTEMNDAEKQTYYSEKYAKESSVHE
jgi:hypothetical protein